MDKSSQYKQIRDYLWRHGTMTPMDAWDALQITKLATRIGEMERKGIIRCEHIREVSKNGKRYMRYNLIEE